VPKYTVQIFGELPDCVTVEAEDEDSAIEEATDKIIGDLDLQAELEEESTCGKEKPE
jgi:hypothetical protein